MGLENRVAVLTGATGGLGRVVAHRLADSGARLALVGTNAEKLSELERELQLPQDRWLSRAVDLREPAAAHKVAEAAVEKFGRADSSVWQSLKQNRQRKGRRHTMELGMIGLGKMGANMTRRLLKGGHRVVVFDPRPEAVQELEAVGAIGAGSLDELVSKLAPPRAAWVMVPSGQITDETIDSLSRLLSAGDTVIDGGNSNYKDSQRHARELAARKLNFMDVGTSGGIWGLVEGYSLMIGGEKQVVERHRPIFETLAPAPDQGWGYVGPAGAGHFVKMIHNGIEYGLMQAYAEGFEIMKAKKEFHLGLHQIAEIWRYGSVVRSWLLDLTARALEEDEDLKGIKAWVPDSGEGRWTVFEAVDLNVAAPVITLSLERRLRSREAEPFADKLLAALRNQFGGHAVKRAE